MMNSANSDRRFSKLLLVIGPGLIVAATGVGAGDLATGALTGSKLGLIALWAVALGALLKFVLNEGLARYQLVSGQTVLEAAIQKGGRPLRVFFLFYLSCWTFLTALALMSACGVVAHALFPLVNPDVDRIIYGLLHSFIALVLVHRGGFESFEKVMSLFVGVMFVSTVGTAIALRPDWGQFLQGLFSPTFLSLDNDGRQWTIGVIGGVGGTVTLLCYGYWIREVGRKGPESISSCRADLAAGYFMTALFGMAMILIGSRITVEGGGSRLVVKLGEQLQAAFGPSGVYVKWAFLVGAWSAVFSSMLGVWQSAPYLFVDALKTGSAENLPPEQIRQVSGYRHFLWLLATIPGVGLWVAFSRVQKAYALFGAAFLPLLAFLLLYLNLQSKEIENRYRNRWWSNLILVAILAFFAFSSWLEIMGG
ncbi:MAG: Nramp family divalent metal transporter [Planctomycetota bacterium]|nr:Nramp family divalent metal transporter [Planctomycetota bacterium]MDA1211991.1 Nramp family divalent metal transporter [Planctomycetota bacterium]